MERTVGGGESAGAVDSVTSPSRHRLPISPAPPPPLSPACVRFLSYDELFFHVSCGDVFFSSPGRGGKAGIDLDSSRDGLNRMHIFLWAGLQSVSVQFTGIAAQSRPNPGQPNKARENSLYLFCYIFRTHRLLQLTPHRHYIYVSTVGF